MPTTITIAKDQNKAMGWCFGSWWDRFSTPLIGLTDGNDFSWGFGEHFPLGLTIPLGSVINSATWHVVSSGHGGVVTIKVKAELKASPGIMANDADYVARRGLTGSGGVSDVGLVTVALLDIANLNWDVWGTPHDFDVTAIIAELVAAFNVSTVELFCDDHNSRSSGYGGANTLGHTLAITFTPPAGPPTVTTQTQTLVTQTSAVFNGTVTAINDTTISERGWVYGMVHHGLPGNVAPAASGYSNWVTMPGPFGAGAFNGGVGSLLLSTCYYCRAVAKNDAGFYAYGAEVSFYTRGTAVCLPLNISGQCRGSFFYIDKSEASKAQSFVACRASAIGSFISTVGLIYAGERMGNALDPNKYGMARSAQAFDTSPVPSNAKISKIVLHCENFSSNAFGGGPYLDDDMVILSAPLVGFDAGSFAYLGTCNVELGRQVSILPYLGTPTVKDFVLSPLLFPNVKKGPGGVTMLGFRLGTDFDNAYDGTVGEIYALILTNAPGFETAWLDITYTLINELPHSQICRVPRVQSIRT